MLTIGIGIILIVGAALVLAIFRARDGIPHPLAMLPGMEIVLPIGIVVLVVAAAAFLTTGLVDVISAR